MYNQYITNNQMAILLLGIGIWLLGTTVITGLPFWRKRK